MDGKTHKDEICYAIRERRNSLAAEENDYWYPKVQWQMLLWARVEGEESFLHYD